MTATKKKRSHSVQTLMYRAIDKARAAIQLAPPAAHQAIAASAVREILAMSPVRPALDAKPLLIAERDAAEATAGHFPVEVFEPRVSDRGFRTVTYYGDSSDEASAVRAGLVAGVEYGPIVTIAALYLVPGSYEPHHALVRGPLSAIRQVFPDRQTLADAEAAGAVRWPRPDGHHENNALAGRPRCRYVPLTDVLKPLQVEYEIRGLQAEAAIAPQ